jgi:hypothetical protein
MYNVFTHNGTEITKTEAISIIGPQFVEILIKENEKSLSKGYDIHNAEMKISRGNSVNVRSSFNQNLIEA